MIFIPKASLVSAGGDNGMGMGPESGMVPCVQGVTTEWGGQVYLRRLARAKAASVSDGDEHGEQYYMGGDNEHAWSRSMGGHPAVLKQYIT